MKLHGTDDSAVRIDSSEAASHAGLWFSVVEPEVCRLCRSRSSWNVVSCYWKGVRSQEVLRWASVCLGCRVVHFGLESVIVEVPEAAQRTCHSHTFYCCCWQLVTGEFPEHLQLFEGQFVQGRLWSDLDWSDVKPETLQTTLESARKKLLELFCM